MSILNNFKTYAKLVWENLPSKKTPVDATNLNRMEEGIAANNEAIKAIADAVMTEITNDPDKIASLAALYAVKQDVTKVSNELANKITNPDSATVGHVLAVETVDADGKPVTYKVVKNEASPADWDVNDENASGYVANRTHWKKVIQEQGTLLDETTINFTTNMISLLGIGTDSISEGMPYIVYWNGTAYECTAFMANQSILLGNAALSSAGDDTGEPFCLEMLSTTSALVMKSTKDAESITIKIEAKEVVVYHKIQKEFLPDDIGGGVTSWNDLTDKPFYEEITEAEILPETTVAFNEDGECALDVTLGCELGSTYTVVWNGTAYECTAQAWAIDGTVAGTAFGDLGLVTGGASTGEPFVIIAIYPENVEEFGVSTMVVSLDGSTEATISITGMDVTIKYLDPKFVEDMYYTEHNKTYIVDNITFDAADGGCSFDNSVSFEIGKTYTVVFNGTEYVCTAQGFGADSADVIDSLYFGNPSVVGGTDNGYPFVVAHSYISVDTYAPEMMLLDSTITGTITVSIYEDSETIHKIPDKYIPNNEPIEINVASDGTCTTTFDFTTASAMTPGELQRRIQVRDHMNNLFSAVRVQKDKLGTIEFKYTAFSDTYIPRKYTVSWGGTSITSGQDPNSIDESSAYSDPSTEVPVLPSTVKGLILVWNGSAWEPVYPTELIMSASDDSAKLMKITVDSSGAITASEYTAS